MTILYGFKLDPQGRVIYRLFERDRMPPDWFDSPNKAERSANPEPPKIDPRFIPRPKIRLKAKK